MKRSHRVRALAAAAVLLCAAAPRVLRAAEPGRPPTTAPSLDALWEGLASQQVPEAVAAVLALVDRGDPAVDFLAAKLKSRKAALDTARVARLIRRLDHADWRTREAAHKELAAIGPAVVPLLREELKRKPSAEVKARIDAILAQLDTQARDSPLARRRLWALEVLGRIATARALRALKALKAAPDAPDRPQVDLALLNLAERVLPRLLDDTAAQAARGDFVAAATRCARALEIARAADHYAAARIRVILAYLRARQHGRQKPAKQQPERIAAAPGDKTGPAQPDIAWRHVRGPNLLANESFENPRVLGIWPATHGVWGGDMAASVPGEQGIKPFAGGRMVRFHHANFRRAGSAGGAQLCQVVDISKYRGAVRAGKVRAVASARFNRVAGDAQTDTLMGLTLIAYAGPVAQHFALTQSKASIAVSGATVHADARPATWEIAAAIMRVPKNTSFLVLQLLAAEDVFNDLKNVEYDGHYADDAFVTLVADAADRAPDTK
jgi:hypothetical protein